MSTAINEQGLKSKVACIELAMAKLMEAEFWLSSAFDAGAHSVLTADARHFVQTAINEVFALRTEELRQTTGGRS